MDAVAGPVRLDNSAQFTGTDGHFSRETVISTGDWETSESLEMDEPTPSQFALLGQLAHAVWCKYQAGKLD